MGDPYLWFDPFEAIRYAKALEREVLSVATELDSEMADYEKRHGDAVAASRGLLTQDVRDFGHVASSNRRMGEKMAGVLARAMPAAEGENG